MNYKIGMRNIKTAISVFLCVVISKLLHLEYPFYAAIAAIISMENSMSNSLRVGKNRMMGTVVGAIIGMVFALISPNDALLCGLGIVAIIYICNLLKWTSSISIAGIVFMAIMVNLRGHSPVFYSLNRILDTLLGISVSLIVNYLVFPHDIINEMNNELKHLHDNLLFTITQVINKQGIESLSEYNIAISRLGRQLEIHDGERKINKSYETKLGELRKNLNLYISVYEHMKMLQNLGDEGSLSNESLILLNEIGIEPISTNAAYSELDTVYNYHLSQVIDKYKNIN